LQLKTPLTVINEFHSHLEPLRFISGDNLSDQISFSYSKYGDEMNVVEVDDIFTGEDDPTRSVG
jgi:fringe protein